VKRRVLASVVVAFAFVVAIPTIAIARDKVPGKSSAKHDGRDGQDHGWAVCREHPILHITPPLTFDTSHAATFAVSDVLESCSSSDPTIDRGIAVINATTASASCGGGTLTGVARIRWNNGRTSRVDFQATFAAGFAHANGNVAGGSGFVGQTFEALDHLNIDAVALQLCGTPSVGVSTLASDGVIRIGDPPVGDGVVWAP